jgi:hypothetical protein
MRRAEEENTQCAIHSLVIEENSEPSNPKQQPQLLERERDFNPRVHSTKICRILQTESEQYSASNILGETRICFSPVQRKNYDEA